MCILLAGLTFLGEADANAQSGKSNVPKGEWELKARPDDYEKSGKLVRYKVVGDAIPKPLTSKHGDPGRGRAIATERDEGNCLACHTLPIPDVPFHGTIGPDLRGIGARLTAGQLRLRIVDPKRIDPKTMMPSYYVTHGLYRVRGDVKGKPILEAQDIEDLVSFLTTMKR
jgi:sulfur-oxidizing protein SoxX